MKQAAAILSIRTTTHFTFPIYISHFTFSSCMCVCGPLSGFSRPLQTETCSLCTATSTNASPCPWYVLQYVVVWLWSSPPLLFAQMHNFSHLHYNTRTLGMVSNAANAKCQTHKCSIANCSKCSIAKCSIAKCSIAKCSKCSIAKCSNAQLPNAQLPNAQMLNCQILKCSIAKCSIANCSNAQLPNAHFNRTNTACRSWSTVSTTMWQSTRCERQCSSRCRIPAAKWWLCPMWRTNFIWSDQTSSTNLLPTWVAVVRSTN